MSHRQSCIVYQTNIVSVSSQAVDAKCFRPDHRPPATPVQLGVSRPRQHKGIFQLIFFSPIFFYRVGPSIIAKVLRS